jgi:hypothetical protein
LPEEVKKNEKINCFDSDIDCFADHQWYCNENVNGTEKRIYKSGYTGSTRFALVLN